MNLGFLGLQFSFGLQQGNMAPIYSYLGAEEAALPILQLAGPVTGLLVQPIVGAMSDRTASRYGRRTPYFLIGALICSFGLLIMPFSPVLWFAAGLLWILDAANNMTMEPYRAYVSDRLDEKQHAQGYLTQSAFTGLAQTLSYLAPSILVWAGMNKDLVDGNNIPVITKISFLIGAVLSICTIAYSIWRVPELPLTPVQRQRSGHLSLTDPLTWDVELTDDKGQVRVVSAQEAQDMLRGTPLEKTLFPQPEGEAPDYFHHKQWTAISSQPTAPLTPQEALYVLQRFAGIQ
jgi:maltose/moltooligosaccharide transporter